MVMGIGMLLIWMVCRFMPKSHCPAIISIFDLDPISTFPVGDKYPLDRIRWSNKGHIIRLVGVRFPLRTVSAAHPLRIMQYKSSFDHDSTIFRQRRFSCDLFHVGRQLISCALIFPGRTLIVHKDHVSLHLRKWCVIANDPLSGSCRSVMRKKQDFPKGSPACQKHVVTIQ